MRERALLLLLLLRVGCFVCFFLAALVLCTYCARRAPADTQTVAAAHLAHPPTHPPHTERSARDRALVQARGARRVGAGAVVWCVWGGGVCVWGGLLPLSLAAAAAAAAKRPPPA